jgi:hypothetical protein
MKQWLFYVTVISVCCALNTTIFATEYPTIPELEEARKAEERGYHGGTIECHNDNSFDPDGGRNFKSDDNYSDTSRERENQPS